MNSSVKRILVIVAVGTLAVMVAALYVGAGSGQAAPDSCCGPGGTSSHSGHGTTDHSAMGEMMQPEATPNADKCPTHAAGGMVLSGKVLEVNNTGRTVTLRIDLPVQGNALTGIAKGDTVSATITCDKAGKAIVKAISADQVATLKLTGIQCQACADRIQSALKGTAGVSQVTVTAAPPRALVSYDPAKTSPDALKNVVRNTKPVHPGTPFGAE